MFISKNVVLSQSFVKRCLNLITIIVLATCAVANSNQELPRSMKAFDIQPARLINKPSHNDVSNANDVLSVARSNAASQFADFVTKTTWLKSTLVDGVGNVTVFAFSDDAYKRSPAVVKAALANEAHPGSRDAVLQFHVALGAHYRKDIAIPKMDRVDTTLTSLFPSPPLTSAAPYQFIHVDTYSIENGMVVTANGAPIIKTDLQASNGVVHIIDHVMYPIPTGANLAEYFQREPNYSVLYAALKKAKLIETLSAPAFEPLTLLAPSDGAFKKLSPAQQALLNNTTILKQVLTYHVMVGSYFSAAFYENYQARSLQGSTIYFEKGAGGIYAEGVKLVRLDTPSTNGVVHELNGVMWPKFLEGNEVEID